MLPYNDVYVVFYDFWGDMVVKGIFSSEHLAEVYKEKLYTELECDKDDIEICTYKLNSMEV